MKLRNVKFYQEGGAMEAPAQASAGAQDPMAVLVQGAQQAVQSDDCEVALQVCQMLLELVGGGGAAPEAAPAEAPVAEETQPVYRMGGRLSRRIPK